MTTRRLTLWLATLLMLGSAACVSSGSTRADARIVVMPISGSDAANGAVTDVVDSRYQLVSSKRYAKTARKLDAKSKKSKDIRKVSRKLDIDAMVAGEFVKRGKRKYELRLSLRAGESGKEFNTLRIKVKSKKLSRRDRNKIKNKLYAALSEVDSWTQDEDYERSRSKRGKRGSGDRERDRARKIREDKHERMREKDERRAEREERRRDEKLSKKERKRAEKREREEDEEREREREEKEARKMAKREKKEKKERKRRDRDDDDDDDDDDDRDDDDDDDRKAKKKKKKKKKKDETYEVVTNRDKSGQALDEESPF